MANVKEYSLPSLSYGYDALEPIISAEIMTLHHSKHHATYIRNLNAALTKLSTSILPSSSLVEHVALLQTIKFNGGGHVNHTLFWENLTPPRSSATNAKDSAPKLIAALERRYGSIEDFKAQFKALLLGIQGSGWGWLVSRGEGILDLITTRDQDVVASNEKPILGVDMWEHAYYLQYQNDKAEYVKRIWEVVNWEVLEKRFLGTTEGVYGEELLGLKGRSQL